MWDLIVSVPDHCLSFYFLLSVSIYNTISYRAGTSTWVPEVRVG